VAESEGLEDYEARSADDGHVGVVQSLVERDGQTYLVVDLSAMPPLTHDRRAFGWEEVAEVDHSALVVRLKPELAQIDEAGLALDAHKGVRGPGAEAVRVARLPDSLTRSGLPGSGPAERPSAFLLAVLAAAAPFSLFAIMAVAIARGLHGLEFGLFAIPLLLAALTVALEGYRLYREPHVARETQRRDPTPHARG
jgi:hypothetical protein